MQKPILALTMGLFVILAFVPMAFAQRSNGLGQPEVTPGPGWLTCPRCQTPQHIRDARAKYKVEGHPFDSHDLSGIWGDNGMELDLKTLPAMTPYGKKLYDATKAEETAPGVTASNEKDGILICDPVGYPRAFAYNYGFEFVMLPDRVLQFFEWSHTWRTIWTDGRKLPADPPQQRWLGYTVGHWEGNTFVVEGNGYDERSWVSEDRRNRTHGFVHSDQMTTVERYQRVSYDTLQATLTVTDPKIFEKPWTTTGKIALRPGTELWEYFCVPSESNDYNNKVTKPGAGAK